MQQRRAAERVLLTAIDRHQGGHEAVGVPVPGKQFQVAAMLLAMEDGFRLHRLIDPNGTPPDSFVQSLSLLQRALSGKGSGEPGDR